MVSADNQLGLYIALPVYFVLLIGCAVWAYIRVDRIKKEGISDHLSAHYLGGRSFGPLLSAGTVFASFFSGYTVVGVVNGTFALLAAISKPFSLRKLGLFMAACHTQVFSNFSSASSSDVLNVVRCYLSLKRKRRTRKDGSVYDGCQPPREFSPSTFW